MTEREMQIEALWTYEISKEKILKRAVKKGFITQEEAEDFSDKLFEQLDTGNIPGFRPSPLGEKMRVEDVRVNPYVSLTDIAREKKASSPSYLIQSWLRSNTTTAYLGSTLQPGNHCTSRDTWIYYRKKCKGISI